MPVIQPAATFAFLTSLSGHNEYASSTACEEEKLRLYNDDKLKIFVQFWGLRPAAVFLVKASYGIELTGFGNRALYQNN